MDCDTIQAAPRVLFTAVTDLTERRRLHSMGFRDREIAEMTGAKRNTITVWRRKEGLSANSVEGHRGRLTPDQAAARMVLYKLGWSDHRIAREQGGTFHAIYDWRKARGLPANFVRGANERWCPRMGVDSLLRRIRRAIATWLPRDLADDAVGDIYVAVLAGEVAIDRIEAEAKRFGARVANDFASKFGPRSLDMDIADSEGFTLLDTLRDDSASGWLEEMGATVW